MPTCQFRDKDNILRTFIHIPKTAGQSFYLWVSDLTNVTKFGTHDTSSQIKSRGIKLGYGFAIVRNPYARMVSNYTYYQNKALDQDSFPPSTNDKDYQKWKRSYEHTKRLQDYFRNTSFDKWIIDCSNDPQMLILTYLKQVKYLKYTKAFYKLEELDQNMHIFESWFNRTIKFPKINVSNKDNIDYMSFYESKNSKRFVCKYFKEDFEKLNYDK